MTQICMVIVSHSNYCIVLPIWNNDLENLSKWSEENNLSFNSNKTKTMLFATNNVIRRFNLDDGDAYQLNIQGNSLERVMKSKILGVMFNQSLSWGDHVNNILKSCYSTLKSLSRLKKLTPFKLRKQLSEMLSKVNPIKSWLLLNSIRRPTKLIKDEETIKQKWLPVQERLDLAVAKLAYKSLYDENFPVDLKNEFQEQRRSLRNITEKLA